MKQPTILIVEDESTLLSILVDTLEGEGMVVLKAGNGHEGLKLFWEKRPDLLVTDVMMPGMDGFELVEKIRGTDKTTPILFLTARSSVDDLVAGFGLGANDYLRKPFKMQELIVRIKALLNRSISPQAPDSCFTIGLYTFDALGQTLLYGTDRQELSYLENEVLRRLCAHRSGIVDVRSLLLELWRDDSFYNRNSLHGYIHKLRKALARDERIKIINVRGIGYKLVVEGMAS